MRRFTLGLLAFFCVFCFLLASQGRAWGYVDPGSGLLALQGFATAMAGVMYYMRRRIRALFSRKQDKPVAPIALRPAPDRSGKAA